MEVDQSAGQLSTISVPKNFEGLAQPLSTRKIKTNIIVQNGDTAVLGGLIKDEELETVKKVPLLGDLPLLGWLFKAKKSDKKKVNMLVFLTPKIIRNAADQQNLLHSKAKERLGFIKEQGGKDQFGSTMDKILKRQSRAPQNEQKRD
jgi:general secretion pathway protein D